MTTPWYRNWRFWLFVLVVWGALKIVVPADQQAAAYRWFGVDPPAAQ